MRLTISAVVPTFRRERHLVDTLHSLIALLKAGDEILVVDQTSKHEQETEAALQGWARAGAIRWYRKSRPSQCEAMNVAAHLARGDLLLFLDDDIVPFENLLEGHRRAFLEEPGLTATSGQVLQPWNPEPLPGASRDRALDFDFASSEACDVLSLMAGNFAMRRETFLAIGGMDENFAGNNYRNDAEMAHRILARTGRRVRFVPQAGMRHLLAGGGNRAFGHKDTWGAIGGSIGDYYFALMWLPAGAAVRHALRRMVRAPLNRFTLRRPWLVPMIVSRELVALGRAVARTRRPRYARPLQAYDDVVPVPVVGAAGT